MYTLYVYLTSRSTVACRVAGVKTIPRRWDGVTERCGKPRGAGTGTRSRQLVVRGQLRFDAMNAYTAHPVVLPPSPSPPPLPLHSQVPLSLLQSASFVGDAGGDDDDDGGRRLAGGGALNVPYAVLEGLVAVGATAGNGLVIVAFRRERRLRRRTNYYIVSLAVADLLVGLVGIPCAVLSSVGLPKQLHLCMLSVSLLVVLCTVSILSLVAVSADRYWAILYPMAYSTNSNTKIAISTCTVPNTYSH